MENWQKYWGVVDCSPPGFSGQESGKEGTDTKQTNKQTKNHNSNILYTSP